MLRLGAGVLPLCSTLEVPFFHDGFRRDEFLMENFTGRRHEIFTFNSKHLAVEKLFEPRSNFYSVGHICLIK